MRCPAGAAARFGFAALGTAGLLLGSVTTATAASESQPGWHVSTVQTPAADSIAFFNAVACSHSSACAAGGFYQDTKGNGGAVVASESAGTWSTARQLAMPGGPAHFSIVSGLACPAAGDCTAVGNYEDSADRTQAFVATESAGNWNTATPVPPPAGSSPNPEAGLAAVTCPAAGACVAVGDYRTADYRPRPMVTAESAGSWQPTTEITLPPDAAKAKKHGGLLASVACTSVRSCVAVGDYDARSGRTLPMAVFESHGHWGRARQVSMPAGAGSYDSLDSISCLPDGECVAVGAEFTARGAEKPIAVTERGGRWSRAVRIGKTGTGATRPMQGADSVSCGTSSCVAIGEGYHGQPLTVTFAHGKWSRYAVILPPTSAGAGTALGLFQVACTGNSACTAVGYLQPKRKAEQLAVARRA